MAGGGPEMAGGGPDRDPEPVEATR